MTDLAPKFRLRMYDTDDTTVLTPRAGSGHTDAFQVSTHTEAGYQPYLDFPRGRRGRLNLLKRNVETGSISVKIMDKDASTLTGGWLTAFWGDDNGRSAMGGKKVVIEQSLEGNAFTTFFTGRVHAIKGDGRIWVTLEIRDYANDLDREIFVERPHLSINYALESPLFPLGFTTSYAGMRPTRKARGIFETVAQTSRPDANRIGVSPSHGSWAAKQYSNVITKSFRKAADGERRGKVGKPNVIVRVDITSGAAAGQSGHYFLDAHNPGTDDPIYGGTDGEGFRRLALIGIRPLADADGNLLTGDTNYRAVPPNDSDVEFDVIWTGPPSEDHPLYLDNVHPVTLWRDLLDGKFGRLQDGITGSGNWGDVTWTIPYDTGAFNSLAADDSIPLGTFKIEESATLSEWVEEHICKPYGLAYYLDADGQVVPIDLRLKTLSGLTTLTNADLSAKASRWQHSRSAAITMAEATWYVEREMDAADVKRSSGEYPDVATTGLVTTDQKLVVADFADTKLKENKWKVDALGYRSVARIAQSFEDSIRKREADLRKILELSKGSYIGGAYSMRLECRRTSNVTGLELGDECILDIDELPDPGSNTRGGTRLARVIGIEERGAAIILDLLDMGPNSTSVTPSLGSLSTTTGAALESIDVNVTLNAAGERVLLEFALTSVGSGQPAEGSALWTLARIVTSSGVQSIGGLPSNTRVYVRARSQSTEEEIKLPSAWVFPSGNNYLDLGGLTAPTLDAISVYDASSCELTWTNGDSDAMTEVYLDQGADSLHIATIEPGGDAYTINGLDASTTYTVKIRHRDAFGGLSTFSSQGVTTTASQPTAPSLFAVAVILGTTVA